MGLADYLLQFRKPGENEAPIKAGISQKYKTDGWITAVIPLSEFNQIRGGGECENALTEAMISGLTFFVHSGGVDGTDCTPNICIDNIRVVPQ